MVSEPCTTSVFSPADPAVPPPVLPPVPPEVQPQRGAEIVKIKAPARIAADSGAKSARKKAATYFAAAVAVAAAESSGRNLSHMHRLEIFRIKYQLPPALADRHPYCRHTGRRAQPKLANVYHSGPFVHVLDGSKGELPADSRASRRHCSSVPKAPGLWLWRLWRQGCRISCC
jgi:hypothetical protein